MYKARTYRRWVKNEDLVKFEVIEKETDLLISAKKDLNLKARESILNYRRDIEAYIKNDPVFYSSLEPVDIRPGAPAIVRAMAVAAKTAGVGPMAAIAGAVAEFVGRDLAKYSEDIIVENGGDIFIKTSKARAMGIYAGDESPFTGKLVIGINPSEKGLGVCTSSGTVSHSLSFGNADAVLIISDDTALADAAATAAGNIVKSEKDIARGVDLAKSIKGVKGALIIVGEKMGSWGEINLI